jgi:hypothetical protein
MLRVSDFDLPAIEENLPGAFLVRSAQDLHQGGFARAVFSEQDVNFAFAQLEIDFIQRDNAGKGLTDALHLKRGSATHGCVSCSFEYASPAP